MHMMSIGMNYKFFILNWDCGTIPRMKILNQASSGLPNLWKGLSSPRKWEKKVNNLDEVRSHCRCFHSSFSHFLRTRHNLYSVGGYPLSRWGTLHHGRLYDIYQLSLTLVLGIDKTWEEEGNAPLCVYHPGSGIDKRLCTKQLIFRIYGQQTSIAVIFHVQSKWINAQENESYVDGLGIYW